MVDNGVMDLMSHSLLPICVYGSGSHTGIQGLVYHIINSFLVQVNTLVKPEKTEQNNKNNQILKFCSLDWMLCIKRYKSLSR